MSKRTDEPRDDDPSKAPVPGEDDDRDVDDRPAGDGTDDERTPEEIRRENAMLGKRLHDKDEFIEQMKRENRELRGRPYGAGAEDDDADGPKPQPEPADADDEREVGPGRRIYGEFLKTRVANWRQQDPEGTAGQTDTQLAETLLRAQMPDVVAVDKISMALDDLHARTRQADKTIDELASDRTVKKLEKIGLDLDDPETREFVSPLLAKGYDPADIRDLWAIRHPKKDDEDEEPESPADVARRQRGNPQRSAKPASAKPGTMTDSRRVLVAQTGIDPKFFKELDAARSGRAGGAR